LVNVFFWKLNLEWNQCQTILVLFMSNSIICKFRTKAIDFSSPI